MMKVAKVGRGGNVTKEWRHMASGMIPERQYSTTYLVYA